MKRIFYYISCILLGVSGIGINDAQADNDPTSAIHLDKKLIPNDDGSYYIRLEAFVTGSSVTTVTQEAGPVDLCLILDESQSMSQNMTTGQSYKKTDFKNYSYNGLSGTLYYKDNSGHYYQVTKEAVDSGNDYYYLYYTTGSWTTTYHYLDGNEIDSSTRPQKYTSKDDDIYLGNLYNNNGTKVTGPFSYNDITNTNYYTSGNNWNRNRVYGGSDDIYYYRLYYKDELNTTHYLTSTGVTTTAPTNITENNKTIWTGELYTLSTTAAKIAELNSAVDSFLETVHDKSPKAQNSSNIDHRVAIVSFSPSGYDSYAKRNEKTKYYDQTSGKTSWGSRIYNDFLEINDNYSTLKNYNFVATGRTVSACGIDDAYYLFSNADYSGDRKDVAKIAVMFTDGVPGVNTYDFVAARANDAIEAAKKLKDLGVTVYTVGVFDEETDDIRNYMNYVSSNYPNAESMNNSGQRISEGNYYRKVDATTSLEDIFKEIASSATEQGETYDLTATTTSVIDIVSNNFVIPTGSSDVKTWVEECTNYSNNEYIFIKKYLENDKGQILVDDSGNWRVNPDYDPYYYDDIRNKTAVSQTEVPEPVYSIDTEDPNKIVVTGFNFGLDDYKENDIIILTEDGKVATPGNYVGARTIETEDGTRTYYYGNRLVIQFKVELNADHEGGYGMPSNDIKSGIYVGNTEIKPFPVPDVDMPAICILKEGLEVGQSAIFEIWESTDGSQFTKTHNVMLTQKQDATSKNKIPCYAVIKNLNKNHYYKVVETAWSWTYNNASPIVQYLCSPEDAGTDKTGIWQGDEILINGMLFGKTKTASVSQKGNVNFIILDPDSVNPDASGSIAVLYRFTNTPKTGVIANGEDMQRNVFKSATVNGGTQEGGSTIINL